MFSSLDEHGHKLSQRFLLGADMAVGLPQDSRSYGSVEILFNPWRFRTVKSM